MIASSSDITDHEENEISALMRERLKSSSQILRDFIPTKNKGSEPLNNVY